MPDQRKAPIPEGIGANQNGRAASGDSTPLVCVIACSPASCTCARADPGGTVVELFGGSANAGGTLVAGPMRRYREVTRRSWHRPTVLHLGASDAEITSAVDEQRELTAPCGAHRVPYLPPYPPDAVLCLSCTVAYLGARGITW
jgi:hypothetical protein